MLDPDPNWYLSTSAQSAAALVAIAGGFVLSRALAIASEKNGLSLRRNELKASLAPWREQIEDLNDRIWEKGTARLEVDATNIFLDDPDVPITDVIGNDDYWLPRALAEETVTAAREVVIRAFDRLRPFAPDPTKPVDPADFPLPWGELAIPGETRLSEVEIIELAWDRLVPKHTDGFKEPGRLSAPAIPNDLIPRWMRDRETARSRHFELKGQLEYVEAELAKVNKPKGFIAIAWALAFFTVTGVLAPLAVLASQPTKISAPVLYGLLGGFCIGLLAVVVVVGRTVASALSPEPMITIEVGVEALPKADPPPGG